MDRVPQYDDEIPFDPKDTISVPFADLTENSLNWAVGAAIGQDMRVSIFWDYDCIDIEMPFQYDHLGEPERWRPFFNFSLMRSIMMENRISLVPRNGDEWTAMYAAEPEFTVSGKTPEQAICRLAILKKFGELVEVPRQLQRREECKDELLKAREMEDSMRQKEEDEDYFVGLESRLK